MNKKVATQKCRTCLKTSTKLFPLTKIVTGCSSNITYEQILKDCAQFEFNTVHELHLPQYLCFLCCSQLKSTYIFVQQAQRCNLKLLNDISKQFCLREQEIDLPQLQDEASVSIKQESLGSNIELEDQEICNFIGSKDNSCNEDNLVTNSILTTEQIIKYDTVNNLGGNKEFIIEPILTTEQIIEYDSEVSVEMDDNNFTTETNADTSGEKCEEEVLLSNKTKTLESVEPLEGLVCNKLIAKSDNEAALFKEKKETPVSCEICLSVYNSKNEYLKHVKEKHNSNQSKNLENGEKVQNVPNLKCKLCDFIGKTYSGLSYHNRSKHGTEKDRKKCKFCSYTTLNKGYLLNHVKNFHKELIKALKANTITTTDESINLNNNNISNKNCITNDLPTTPGDEDNISDKSNDEKDEEEFSDEDFIRNLINMKKKPRKKLSTKTLVARCEECGKILKNQKTLADHQRHVHKSEDMFSSCPHCNKKCKRETDLKIHIRQMHGPRENRQIPKPRSKEKRYMCAECSYTCMTSTKLNIHIRLRHTGERPYKCDLCSKSFVVANRLKLHRYLHTGERPYKCHICSKSFREPSHMRKHIRLHSNKYPFTCDDCGKGFTQSYNLSVHKRTHLKGEKLNCSVCGKFFKNMSILNIHQINENHYEEAV